MNAILEVKIIKWEAHRSRADASMSPELAIELRRDFLEVFDAGMAEHLLCQAARVERQIKLTEKARES